VDNAGVLHDDGTKLCGRHGHRQAGVIAFGGRWLELMSDMLTWWSYDCVMVIGRMSDMMTRQSF
jgi:hypothetical protein